MNLSIALLISGGFHVVLLFTHGLYIAVAHGVGWGIGRRSEPLEKSDLDRRFERSIANNVESLTAFVPICAGVAFLGVNGSMIELSTLAYVVARLGFVTVYLANITYIRTAFWFVGQGATVILLVAGFTAIQSVAKW